MRFRCEFFCIFIRIKTSFSWILNLIALGNIVSSLNEQCRIIMTIKESLYLKLKILNVLNKIFFHILSYNIKKQFRPTLLSALYCSHISTNTTALANHTYEIIWLILKITELWIFTQCFARLTNSTRTFRLLLTQYTVLQTIN